LAFNLSAAMFPGENENLYVIFPVCLIYYDTGSRLICPSTNNDVKY